MRSRMVVRLVMLSTILALPVVAHAQDASVSGMVTYSSGAVLRGATVRAVHESTGNTFDDNKGAMR